MLTNTGNKLSSCADDFESDILSVDEARKRILADIDPVTGFEKLALRASLGRVLDEDIISPIDVPGHTNSAMDGYALNYADLVNGIREFTCIGTAYAGGPFSGQNESGQCVRIMTGAPVPAGTDTVVMQEQAEVIADGRIQIAGDHRVGQNIRQAGEDIPAGSVILNSGHILVPADLGVLASLGIGELHVRRRARVAFFSTGDELRSLGESLGEGELYDSNRYSLYGMLTRLGLDVVDMGVVRDDPAALREAFLNAAKNADVVITSGGVSVGEADYIKTVLDEIGEIGFWKIAMKPGRPLTFGQLNGAHFFGLPGNPVAVMVSFYQFVLPALHYLSTGRTYLPFMIHAQATQQIRKRPGRTEFVRGILEHKGDATYQVQCAGRQGSGILSSMSRANCFILLPESSGDVMPGDMVLAQPFAALI